MRISTTPLFILLLEAVLAYGLLGYGPLQGQLVSLMEGAMFVVCAAIPALAVSFVVWRVFFPASESAVWIIAIPITVSTAIALYLLGYDASRDYSTADAAVLVGVGMVLLPLYFLQE